MGFLSALFGRPSKDKLNEAIQNKAFLVDVRTPAEFSAGHVKGSVNIPLDKLSNQLGKFKNKKNIVVFCQSGGRSHQAKVILERNGHTDVINGGSWRRVAQATNG